MILREARVVYSGKRVEGSAIVKSADDVHRMCRDLENETQEHFVVLLLDRRHKVLARQTIAIGSVGEVVIQPRETFRAAIMSGASAIIMVHNHPSGNPEPSIDDLSLTARFGNAGDLLGIPVLDHVVIGDNCFFSIKDACNQA
jgi:DNA repair protein RadC